MSNYTINNLHGFPANRTLEVGWDAPFASFFGRAFDPPTGPGEDERQVFWVGSTPCELPTVESLTDALRTHGVELPFPLEMALGLDKSHEGERVAGRPATELVAASSLLVVSPEQAARIRAALEGSAQ